MLPDEFLFLRPYWMLAFIPLIAMLFIMVKRKLRSRKWESLCDKELLPYILIGDEPVSKRTSAILLGLTGALLILSLAGPVWEKLPQPVFSTQSALIIALDLSRSMNATDILPSRIDRARFKVTDILQKRGEGETALLVYAGDAFTVTPLTDDSATIESQLMALTTEIMPAQGNRTDIAMSKAIDLLKQAGASKGDILFITDEIDLDRTEVLAQAISNDGYRLSLLGIGTLQGAPITMADGSFFKDQSGQIVIPKLSEEPMRQLALVGAGRYQKMTVDDNDIDALTTFFSSNYAEGDVELTDFETDVWLEQGPWLLFLLIPMVLMVFRRGVLVMLVIMCLPYTEDVSAAEWDELWLRTDQIAKQELDKGEIETAAEMFEDPAWKGAAHYRAGNFDDALKFLQETEGVENKYNLGNTLARKGMYEQAISLYDEVLAENPDNEDAKYNKELLEKELEQQQEEQQQPQESMSDENQEEQDQEQQNQNQDDSQQDQQQSDQQDEMDPNEDQQQQETEQQSEDAEEQPPEEQNEDPGQPEPLQANQDQAEEEKQATEQWLRRIPDDPGGLLRRKFLMQYQQKQRDRVPGEKLW
ncbi:MAG: Ca-activated chloride channel family protein [Gammaproteobacteria bacterium]|jgi:Ca-activated chloride channel family protein